MRLLRLANPATVFSKGLAVVRHLLRTRRLGYVIATFVVVALAAGGLFAVFEGYSLSEGLWWTVVTITTVGYGDITPVTAGGRATAVLLMLSGFGVLSFITANVAAYFVESGHESDTAEQLHSIEHRQVRIEASLGEIRDCLTDRPQDSDNE